MLHGLPVGFRSPASSCSGWEAMLLQVVRHRQPCWTMAQVSWVAPHCSSRQGGHGAPTRGSRLNRKAPKAPPGWQMCLKGELPGTSAPATTCLLIPACEGKRPRRPARARRGWLLTVRMWKTASIVVGFFPFILKLKHVSSCIFV